MCGSDATFGGRRAFYDQHGDYVILDYDKAVENGIIPSDYLEYWGMEDEKLFAFAKQQLSEIAQNENPFNFTMLTVDTHHPEGYACRLCQNQHGSQFANAISCASRQVYDFISWCQEQEWYENTTIVVTGDHLSMNNTFGMILAITKEMYTIALSTYRKVFRQRGRRAGNSAPSTYFQQF